MCPHILREHVSGPYYLNYLQTHLGGLLEDMSFNKCIHAWIHHEVLRHIAAVKRVTGCQNCLDTVDSGTEGPVDWPARSPDFYTNDFFFCGDILKPTYVPLQSILQMSYGVEFNDLKLKQEIHTQSSNDCESPFLPMPSFVSMNMEAI
jgi:hypothetical protein